jgi:hypothetical protein
MSITATVINDTIKLPEGTHLEDGTLVEVMPKKASAFLERFKDIIGTAGSGIGDLAENHDHYLHGAPKKSVP